MFYLITTKQNGQPHYFKGSAHYDGIRIAVWTTTRVKGHMFVSMDNARNCIERDGLKNWAIEGPGGTL